MSDEKQRLKRMVNDFATEMVFKLEAKMDEGWSGWDDHDMQMEFETRLIVHVMRATRGEKGQWVDVANFAAFLDAIESATPDAEGDSGE